MKTNREEMRIAKLRSSVPVTVLFAVLATPAALYAACGDEGQRACCLGEKSFGACKDGLHESTALGTCKEVLGASNCHCSDNPDNLFDSIGICVADTPCGGEGERACCFWERIPACESDLKEAGNCDEILGAAACGCSIGVCTTITHCGDEGERACCFGEDNIFDGCRGNDLIQDSSPTCAEKLGALDCECATGFPAIGWCRKKRGVGDSCTPVLDPCEPGLLCLAVGFEGGWFQYACFADLDDTVSREACNAFYDGGVHQSAVNDNVTYNFGYGTSSSAGASGSIENGVVYGRDGCYGCYHTQCTGLEIDLSVSAFVVAGQSWVDLVCDSSDPDCISFDGQACVFTEGGSIPATELGVSLSEILVNCPTCGFDKGGTCEPVGIAETFSIGLGIVPVALGVADCTTLVTVGGCLDDNGEFVAITNEPPVCDAGGSYDVECNGSSPTVSLASASSDPDGDSLTHAWSVSGCSGASLNSSSSSSPTYTLAGLGSCSTVCNVDLTVDDGEESASCSTTITINDTSDPTVTCPADQTLECDSSTDTSVSANGSAAGSDTCDPSVSISNSDSSVAGCGNTQTITRTWTATDDCGLTDSCAQIIAVVDTTKPSMDTAASSSTVECDGAGNGGDLTNWLDDHGGADASDACDASVAWSNDFSSLSDECGATGAATVTFTATDDCDNSSTTMATFTIEDTAPPTFSSCPGTIYQESPAGSCTDNVSYSVAASDVCGSTSIVCLDQNNKAVGSTGDTFPVGTTTVTCTATDDCGLSSMCSFDVIVNDPPQITGVSLATQSVQYSDKIVPVVITATDCGPDSSLTLEFDSLDVPNSLALSSTADWCGLNASNVVECTWTLDNDDRVLEPQGTYVLDGLKAVDPTPLNGVTLKSAPDESIIIEVNAENATIAFDGGNPVAVQVATDGGNSGMFDLTVDVQELFPEIATAGGELPGDIGLAVVSMTLAPVGPGGPANGICTADNDPNAYDYSGMLTVTCQFDNVAVNTYTIEAVLIADGAGELYYTGSNEDVLVVFDPSLGFTTGGGWFHWPPEPEEADNHYPGDRTNFGYTMKYNRKRTNIQGSLLLIRHLPDGRIYRVKSNALYGLALGDESSFGWASFAGKGTFKDPDVDEPEGNHEFVAYVEDLDEPGAHSDRFWLQVFDKDGVLIRESSMFETAVGKAVTIEGGNIVVPHQGPTR